MSVLLSFFYPKIYDFIKGIELSQYATTLATATTDGVRRFCTDTGIWQKTLAEITVTSPTRTFDLTLPTDSDDGKADLVHVEWAKYRLTADSTDQYVALIPRTRLYMETYYGSAWEYQTGRPTIFVVDEPKSVVIYPIPNSSDSGVMSVRVALRPTKDATKVIDYIFNKYEYPCIYAILYEIYRFTNKPWSDQEIAEKYLKRYHEELYVAKNFAQSGLNKTTNSPFFPQTGGSRNSDRNW